MHLTYVERACAYHKTTVKPATTHTASEATCVDAAGGKVAVAVWDKANQLIDSLDIGARSCFLGCNATVQDGEVRLNIWPGAHISTSGEQAQSLARLNADSLTTQTLTATTSPVEGVATLMPEGTRSQRALWRWQMLWASQIQ